MRVDKRRAVAADVSTRHKERAAIGFTVKSGWTSAVLVIGPATRPRVVDSQTIDLSDPAIPESRQPYHAGFGTARAAGARLSTLVASVERFGQQSVARLMSRYQAAAYDVRGVGLVVGSLIDPANIANDHIRIHALEGQLFRGVVEKAAGRTGCRARPGANGTSPALRRRCSNGRNSSFATRSPRSGRVSMARGAVNRNGRRWRGGSSWPAGRRPVNRVKGKAGEE